MQNFLYYWMIFCQIYLKFAKASSPWKLCNFLLSSPSKKNKFQLNHWATGYTGMAESLLVIIPQLYSWITVGMHCKSLILLYGVVQLAKIEAEELPDLLDSNDLTRQLNMQSAVINNLQRVFPSNYPVSFFYSYIEKYNSIGQQLFQGEQRNKAKRNNYWGVLQFLQVPKHTAIIDSTLLQPENSIYCYLPHRN